MDVGGVCDGLGWVVVGCKGDGWALQERDERLAGEIGIPGKKRPLAACVAFVAPNPEGA